MTVEWFAHHRDVDWSCTAPSDAAIEFHRTLPGYAPTPLVSLPELAVEFGVGHVFAKDESSRLGLPAFKGLGASWAIHKALQLHSDGQTKTIVTATDGNHGRAVAKFSKMLGHRARIYTPEGVHPSAIQAIRDEGAEVIELQGNYDETVAAAAQSIKSDSEILVQDTAWAGYEEIPNWIVEGYATLFAEVDHELSQQNLSVNLALIPTGVGSLLQSALSHYRSFPSGTAVVSVEPTEAACIAPSLNAQQAVTVETGVTVMAGLNCGTPSELAWPYILHGIDGAVAVTDDEDLRAARDLADLGVQAGPCGAAGLAAARKIFVGDRSAEVRHHLGINKDSVILLLVTEGSAANPVEGR
jgi:diaminopropionate ammonia-lyase